MIQRVMPLKLVLWRIPNFLFCFFFLAACNQTSNAQGSYPQDVSISDIHGKPKDSLVSYFPTSVRRNNKIVPIEMDSTTQRMCSKMLFSVHEPVLSNYYQGYDIYRFIWIRDFASTMIFTLNILDDQAMLTTKVINPITTMRLENLPPPPIYPDTKKIKGNKRSNKQKDSIKLTEVPVTKPNSQKSKPTGQTSKIISEVIQLTVEEWDEFEKLLSESSFWKDTIPQKKREYTNRSRWIIEAHLKDNYWLINKQNPEGSIKEFGKFLIDMYFSDKDYPAVEVY